MKSPDRNRLDKLLHPLCAILLHLLRHMAIHIRCESSSGTAAYRWKLPRVEYIEWLKEEEV